jgi:hypothetical protein
MRKAFSSCFAWRGVCIIIGMEHLEVKSWKHRHVVERPSSRWKDAVFGWRRRRWLLAYKDHFEYNHGKTAPEEDIFI